MIVSFVCSVRLKNDILPANENVVVLHDTSLLLKAICCIVIILHHYSLRVHSSGIGTLLSIGGGSYALSIFLFLSAYGITKSEMIKACNLKAFVKKRFVKLLRPYTILTIIAIAAYWLIGANAPLEELQAARINPAFVHIGNHQKGLLDFFYYIIGIESFSGSMWFVGVTLYSYLAFFICKSFFNIGNQRFKCFVTYLLLILSFAIIVFILEFPLHFYRNLWALALGMLLALYEKEYLSKSRLQRVVIYVLGNITVYTYLLLSSTGDAKYLLFANLGVLSISVFNQIFKRYSLSENSVITTLAALSYVVYLVHGKVLTVEWWYIGYSSVIVAVIASITFAYIYSKIEK